MKISVSGGGSGSGIAQVAARRSTSATPTSGSGHPELHDNRVAVVGFAVVAHPGVGVKNLSRSSCRTSSPARSTNWKEVGGPDQKIVVDQPPAKLRNPRRVHEDHHGQRPDQRERPHRRRDRHRDQRREADTGRDLVRRVQRHARHGLPEVCIDGVEPTDDNIIHGKYPIWSYEHMFTHGPPTGEVSRFIAFVQSNAELVKQDGFILIRDMRVTETDR